MPNEPATSYTIRVYRPFGRPFWCAYVVSAGAETLVGGRTSYDAVIGLMDYRLISEGGTMGAWPTFEYEGKLYAYGDTTGSGRAEVLVWRCASRRTGRYSWRIVRSPPAAVKAAFENWPKSLGLNG